MRQQSTSAECQPGSQLYQEDLHMDSHTFLLTAVCFLLHFKHRSQNHLLRVSFLKSGADKICMLFSLIKQCELIACRVFCFFFTDVDSRMAANATINFKLRHKFCIIIQRQSSRNFILVLVLNDPTGITPSSLLGESLSERWKRSSSCLNVLSYGAAAEM